MRAFRFMGILLAGALGACGSVNDRPSCSASADCPVGQYCAHTADGDVCWADAVPPTVSNVTVWCSNGATGASCLRDGVLRVTATVTDDHEVLGAEVALDVGGAPVQLLRGSGGTWTGNIELSSVPFDHFEHAVVVTVTARDGARNTTLEPVAAGTVTRHRWTFDAGAPITSPAVMQDGTVVVGVHRTSQQVLGIGLDGTKKWEATTATKFITAAPSIGAQAIWVSDDRTVYAIDPISHVTIAGVGVALDGATSASLATRSDPAPDWVFVGSASGRLGGASTIAGDDARSTLGDACTTGPAISADGSTLFVAAKNVSAGASLRSFGFDGAFAAKWSVGIGVNVTAPLAIDGSGNVWTVSQDSKLYRTVPSEASADPVAIATLSGSGIDSPVILAGGDVVVGDAGGVLHRYSATGTSRWTVEPNLGSPVLAPIVLQETQETLLVPTQGGRVHALRGDGSIAWYGELDPTGLRGANIHTPPIATSQALSTVFLAGQGGVLHAVIVDGKLDGSAPWPKAFHDPRNTNRAGAQP